MRVLYLTLFVSFILKTLCDPTVDLILDRMMDKPPKDLFRTYHLLFKKEYALESEEARYRFRVFKQNLQIIKEHNAKNLGWNLGITEFADLTPEEFKARHLVPTEQMEEKIKSIKGVEITDVRAENRSNIDHSGLFIEVRNQGSCGSCWAFTTTAVVEANWFKANPTSPKRTFSPQQLVDCDTRNHGCNGGWYNAALDHIIDNGIVEEKAYPYIAKGQTCALNSTNATRYYIDDYQYCNSCGIDKWFKLFSKGPVAVAVDASNWGLYKNGTITLKGCKGVNHAVTATGWTIVNADSEVLTIRNSWGTRWGEKGFMRINVNYTDNTCFALNYAYLPLFGIRPSGRCLNLSDSIYMNKTWFVSPAYNGSVSFNASGSDFTLGFYYDFKSSSNGYLINFGINNVTVSSPKGFHSECSFNFTSINPNVENSYGIRFNPVKYSFDIQVNNNNFNCKQYYYKNYCKSLAFWAVKGSDVRVCDLKINDKSLLN